MSGPFWQAILLENIIVMLRETEAEEKRERRDEEARAFRWMGSLGWDGIGGLGGCGVLDLANLRLLTRDGQVPQVQMSLAVVARLSSSGDETSINQLN
jgi:hypothetical protein